MKKIKVLAFWLFCYALIPGKIDAQNLDSMIQALEKAAHDTARIKIFASLAEACDNTDILKYAGPQKKLCEKAIAAKLEPAKFYRLHLASAINNIGFYYSKLGEQSKALDNYKLALKLYEAIHDTVNAAYALNNIAFIYDNQGDVSTALEYFYKNLKLQEEIKDSTGMAYSLNNIAFVFDNQQDEKNALDYFNRSLAIFESRNDKKGVAMVYGNMGTACSVKGSSENALGYFKKSLSIYEEVHDNYSAAHELSAIGFEYAKTGQDSLAYDYFKRGLKVAEEYRVKIVQAYALTGMARILLKKEDIKTAQEFALRSLQLGRELGNPKDIQNPASVLKEIYTWQGNYKEAYAMFELEIKMRDSISNETNRKVAITKKLQYQYEKKELLSKLDTEKALERRNIIVLISLAIAVVTALLAFLFVRHNKLKARLQWMELEQQQYRAQMNPHFIFNCMNAIQHYIVYNDVKLANKFLSQFAGLMRRTLDINTGNFITVEEEINYMENYLQLEQMRFDGKFSYKIICAEDINRNQICLPTMMLQPFAENAIQHGLRYLSDNSGVLSISFAKENNMLVCTIDDNGIGREAVQHFKKQPEITHQSQGMALIENKLAVLNKIHKSNASLMVIDKEDAAGKATGTSVILKLPLTWK